MDNYEALIAELGNSTGIDGMQPDEDGAVQLLFDETLPVFIQPDRDRSYVSIYAVVGLVDETVPGPLMLELLSASLFGREANGATFAVEETMGQIVLQHQERLDGWTYQQFEQALHRFVEAAEAWRNRLTPGHDEHAGQLAAVEPQMSEHHLKP